METAAGYVGCPLEQVRETMRRDEKFAEEVGRAIAGVEVEHMRNLLRASRDDRQWRVSVWWLEAMAPGRYKPRDEDRLTRSETRRLLERVCGAVAAHVSQAEDRERLIVELERMAQELHDAPEWAPAAEEPETKWDTAE